MCVAGAGGGEDGEVDVEQMANQSALNEEIQNQNVLFLDPEEDAGTCMTCVVS